MAITEINNYQIFDYYNKQFNSNHQIRLLIKKIFQTEHEGEIGYIMSTWENFEGQKYKNIPKFHNEDRKGQPDREIIDIEKAIDYENNYNIIDYNQLGQEEASLFNYLSMPNFYTHIILTGALGSGKTALLKFIKSYLDSPNHKDKCVELNCCGHKKPIAIKIDFNTGYSTEDKNQLFNQFYRELYRKFEMEVQRILSCEALLEEVLRGIVNRYDNNNFAEFADFEDDMMKNSNWQNLSHAKKTRSITKWIEDKHPPEDFKGVLKALFDMLRHIIDFLKLRNRECFICIFDNIDRFEDSIQAEMLEKIFSITNELKIKHIIAVRLTAFGNISQGTYSYCIFEHTAPPIEKIIRMRIEYYLNNKSIYSSITNQIRNKDLVKALNERLRFILNEMKKEDSASIIKRSIKALSGVSVRRGLFICERFFLNNSIKYDTNTPLNFFLRALFVGENENCKIYNEDQLIANIFIDPLSEKNSLLAFKLLHVLWKAKSINERLTISKLYEMLKLITSFSDEEFLKVINYLMYVKRRLIYVNGISSFQNIQSCKSCKSYINITNSGIGYASKLYSTVQYVQDCFSVIDWSYYRINQIQDKIRNHAEYEAFKNRIMSDPSVDNDEAIGHFLISFVTEFNFSERQPYIPNEIDYTSIIQRYGFIRKCLTVLLVQDICEFVHYYILDVFERNDDSRKYFNQITSVEITVSLSHHVYNSLVENANKDELYYWYNLLLIIRYWNMIIFNSSEKIDSIINKMEEYFNITRFDYKKNLQFL